jgi:GTP-binding protein
VAILGKPNVGKSTLFNRLIGRRTAIVEDQPGVTRDRHYAPCRYGKRWMTLVDTGGLDPDAKGGLLGQIRRQAEAAIREADVLVVLFDGREGASSLDQELISLFRKIEKPIVYAVNKLDTPRQEALLAEFHRYGLKRLVPVSAEQGIGVDEVMEQVAALLPPDGAVLESETPGAIPRIAVVGRPNVGKSTFINRLLGEERMITSEVAGTTRDAIDSEVSFDGRSYQFIDTAGIRRRGKIDPKVERYSISRAYAAIDRCDVAVVMLDAGEGLVEQDTKIVGRVLEAKKGAILIVNKWDLCRGDAESQMKIRAGLDRRLVFVPFAPIEFISAIEAFEPARLFKLIDEVTAAYRSRIPTGALNRAFEKALSENPPPTQRGRIARLYYITQAGNAPPTFVIFANDPKRIKDSYKRYIENFLRREFGFTGTPLVLLFRRRK